MENSDLGSLPSALRTATRAAHHRVDHHPLLAPLVRPDLSADQYAAALAFFQRFYSVAEPALRAAAERLQVDYAMGERLAWLEADLRHFPASAACQVAIDLPALGSRSELVGCLYVIEGSTQGGQVIGRLVRESLGVGPERGGRFFHGWGPDTASHWQAFWQFAERHCSDQSAAVTAARATFDALIGGLELATRTLAAASEPS